MIRFFRETLAPVLEGGGGSDAPTVFESGTAIAAAMAKTGRRVEGDSEFGQKPQEPAPAKSAPPKIEATPPAPPKVETTEKTPPATEPAKTEAKLAPVVEANWRDALKKEKPDAILKELGFDDKQVRLLQTLKADPKMLGFFDTWSSKGDVNAYLKAASTDYSKMSPEDVMRHSLRDRNSEMPDDDFKELYAMKVIERYKLDPEQFTEAEVRRGRIELMADAKEHRETLTKQQQDYLLSAAPDQTPDNSAAEAAQAATQMADTYKKNMKDDAFVKDVLSNKTIKIGDGEDAFNYSVEPDKLMDVLNDPKKWAAAMFKSVPDENGNGDFVPDARKQMLVSAMAVDPDGFLTKYATHYMGVGAKKALAEIENVSTPGGTPSKGDATPASPAAALAKRGRIVKGDE